MIQGNTVKQRFHVLQGRDGDSDLTHLTHGHGMIGVIANLRRQIKRHAQTLLTAFEKKFIALVRGLCRPKTGVLPHGPQPPTIHRRMHTACIRELPGEIELLEVRIEVKVERRVEALHRNA